MQKKYIYIYNFFLRHIDKDIKFQFMSFFLHIMDLSETLHDFHLMFLRSGLILGSLRVAVLLTNPNFSSFSLGMVLV